MAVQSLEIRDFSVDRLDDVAALKERHVPASGERWKRRFRWQFLDNPSHADDAAVGLILVSGDDRIVGCTFAMPQRFKIGDADRVLRVSTDTLVDSDYRKGGHGFRLFMEYFRRFADPLGLGTSASQTTVRIWQSCGGITVPAAHDQFHAILRPRAFFRKKIRRLAGPLADALAVGMGFAWCAGHWSRYGRASAALPFETTTASDPRLATIWERSHQDYCVTAVRDEAFLQWRHGMGQSRIVVILRKDGTPVSWAAYVDASKTGGLEIKHARVLDVFGDLGVTTDCRETIRSLLIHLREEGYDAADFRGLHPSWRTALVRIGCRQVRDPNTFVYRFREQAPQYTQNSASWHLVPADGDLGFWDLSDFPRLPWMSGSSSVSQ